MDKNRLETIKRKARALEDPDFISDIPGYWVKVLESHTTEVVSAMFGAGQSCLSRGKKVRQFIGDILRSRRWDLLEKAVKLIQDRGIWLEVLGELPDGLRSAWGARLQRF